VVSDLPAACLQEALLALRVLLAQARLRPQVAAVLCQVFPALAPAPEVARSASLARPSAGAVRPGRPAQQLAGSGASAQPAAARRLEEPAAQDAAVLPEAAVAAWAAAEVLQQAAEPPGVAAAPQREVPDAVAGRRPAAPDAEVVRQLAARDAEGRQREVRGGPAAELPLAVAWVFHRDQVLPWPGPQPAARFARAMACLQIAAPSERWWQAATNEVLS
jgi:hypothetical protein